jgi:hypothetical protein
MSATAPEAAKIQRAINAAEKASDIAVNLVNARLSLDEANGAREKAHTAVKGLIKAKAEFMKNSPSLIVHTAHVLSSLKTSIAEAKTMRKEADDWVKAATATVTKLTQNARKASDECHTAAEAAGMYVQRGYAAIFDVRKKRPAAADANSDNEETEEEEEDDDEVVKATDEEVSDSDSACSGEREPAAKRRKSCGIPGCRACDRA